MLPLLMVAWRKGRRFDPRRTERRRGVLRVVAYGGTVTLGLLAFGYHSARAEAVQKGMDLGRELGPLVRALPGDVKQISLNGQTLYVSETVATQSRKEVLDAYETHCASNPGQPFAAVRQATEAGLATEPSKWKSMTSFRSFRNEGDRAGLVFCFVKGEGTPDTLAEAADAFQKTQDLGALGRIRYAYVEDRPQGGARVLTLWTDHHFRMDHLSAEGTGDVPGGTDFTDSPRPDASRRLLSGKVEGHPYAVNVYETKLEPKAVVDTFDATMMGAGWASASPPVPGAESHGYIRGQVIYTVSASKEEGRTIVAVSRSDGPGDTIGRLD